MEALPYCIASIVASVVLLNIIFEHGCLQQILFDQGDQFRSVVIKLLTQGLGIEQHFTSPYHLQTNNLIDHMNETINKMLLT